jgi:hypothetical protein
LENWIPTCRTLPVSHLVQASIQNWLMILV